MPQDTDLKTGSSTDQFNYCGDVNLEHGGMFFDLTNWPEYVDVVRVTDIDSGCGFTGAVMIEHNTTFWFDQKDKVHTALQSIGMDLAEFRKMPLKAKKMCLCDAFIMYGYSDPDDSWDGYRTHYCTIIQMDEDEPLTFDGWTAERFEADEYDTLMDYVDRVHLDTNFLTTA